MEGLSLALCFWRVVWKFVLRFMQSAFPQTLDILLWKEAGPKKKDESKSRTVPMRGVSTVYDLIQTTCEEKTKRQYASDKILMENGFHVGGWQVVLTLFCQLPIFLIFLWKPPAPGEHLLISSFVKSGILKQKSRSSYWSPDICKNNTLVQEVRAKKQGPRNHYYKLKIRPHCQDRRMLRIGNNTFCSAAFCRFGTLSWYIIYTFFVQTNTLHLIIYRAKESRCQHC